MLPRVDAQSWHNCTLNNMLLGVTSICGSSDNFMGGACKWGGSSNDVYLWSYLSANSQCVATVLYKLCGEEVTSANGEESLLQITVV